MMRGAVLDPVSDPRWYRFVSGCADALVFHHPAWLTLLRDQYGYEMQAWVVLDDERIAAILASAAEPKAGCEQLVAEANVREAQARYDQAREFAALDSRVTINNLLQARAAGQASQGRAGRGGAGRPGAPGRRDTRRRPGAGGTRWARRAPSSRTPTRTGSSRSAIRSSADSMPTLRRIRSGGTSRSVPATLTNGSSNRVSKARSSAPTSCDILPINKSILRARSS